MREFPAAAVAVYHPKPPRDVTEEQVRAGAAKIGLPGALAVDRDWRVLDRNWPPEARRFTSVMFVLDAAGRIRWLHAGGELGAADVEALRRVLAALTR